MDVREKLPSEKRLIDREALLSFEKMDAELCATCGEHHTAEDVIMMIKTAPTVDAVPVVRCRECIAYTPVDDNTGKCVFLIGKHQYVVPDGYCYLGERKEGAE